MLAIGVMRRPTFSPKKPSQKALNPRCKLKLHLQELFLKKWKNLWDNGNTRRSVHKVLKTVHLKPVFWTSEEILFITGHDPLPLFLNRFHVSDSDSCACEEIGDPIHYATTCPLSLSWCIGSLLIHWKVCGTKESWRIRIQEKE
ncbi:hypothetical protein AVEN_50449-1 [Araneus ventricosus]|uniref:Uncharacterized protein n=1 Tax=Araneus ventricosus TaxID=182803 RepID=A0A4Y2H6B0_ARAVE|nr:hypothetical protein AVEN_50449-1 [Araneus ventricosus]